MTYVALVIAALSNCPFRPKGDESLADNRSTDDKAMTGLEVLDLPEYVRDRYYLHNRHQTFAQIFVYTSVYRCIQLVGWCELVVSAPGGCLRTLGLGIL